MGSQQLLCSAEPSAHLVFVLLFRVVRCIKSLPPWISSSPSGSDTSPAPATAPPERLTLPAAGAEPFPAAASPEAAAGSRPVGLPFQRCMQEHTVL